LPFSSLTFVNLVELHRGLRCARRVFTGSPSIRDTEKFWKRGDYRQLEERDPTRQRRTWALIAVTTERSRILTNDELSEVIIFPRDAVVLPHARGT
jgi:hypothetical protein